MEERNGRNARIKFKIILSLLSIIFILTFIEFKASFATLQVGEIDKCDMNNIIETYKKCPKWRERLINYPDDFWILVEIYKEEKDPKMRKNIVEAFINKFLQLDDENKANKKVEFISAYREMIKYESNDDVLDEMGFQIGYNIIKRLKYYEEGTSLFSEILEKPLDTDRLKNIISSMYVEGNNAALPILADIINKYNQPEVREAAFRGIWYINTQLAIDYLREFTKSEETDIRVLAYYYLMYDNFKADEKFIDELLYRLENDKDDVKRAITMAFPRLRIPNNNELKNNIINKIANKINEQAEIKSPYEIWWAISILNGLYHIDGNMRVETIKKLNFKAKYYLMSIAFDVGSYQSTFDLLYKELIKEKNFTEKIKEIDPNEKYSTIFTLNLAAYNHLEEAIKLDQRYFFNQIKKILEGFNLEPYVKFLFGPISFILKNKNLEINKDTQNLLLKLYDQYKNKKDIGNWGSIGFIIKANKEYFDNREKAEEISLELPEPPGIEIPREWLKDGKIVAKLYFYDEWFDYAANYYLQKIGIKKLEIMGDKIIITLKPGNKLMISKNKKLKKIKVKKEGNYEEVILSLENFEPFEAYIFEEGKTTFRNLTFYKTNGNITIVIKKSYYGKDQIIILTKDNSDVLKTLEDESIDIMVHRGHSFQLYKTFPPDERVDCKKKLLYFGSCSSFRAVANYQQNYTNCLYLSDKDTGRGEDNNKILEVILDVAIRKSGASWEVVKDEINKKIKPEPIGIVYPGDYEVVFDPFMKEFRERYWIT